MRPDFEEVRQSAIERATDWALGPAGEDRFEIDGLGAAGPLRVEAFNLLLPIYLEAAGLSADLSAAPAAAAAKRWGLDRGLRALALRAAAYRARLGAARAPAVDVGSICFLSELATPSALEPSLAVAARLPPARIAVLAGDPRAFAAWRRHGQAPRPLTMPFLAERRLLRDAGRSAAARWHAFAASPPRFLLDERDLTTRALAALRPLVLRSLPWLHVERAAIARRLDESPPSRLVLASDQHRLARLAVAEARARRVATVVLQHGLPDSSIGYLPVVADEVCVWSEAAREWFVAGGADPGRLRILGNARFDRLVQADRPQLAGQVAARYGLPGRPRLLLALSPTAEHRNERLTRIALEWLERTPAGALIVKVHPGEGRWRQVREAGARSAAAARLQVLHREPLEPLLAWADVTFLHRSTVALESLAAGTPVVVGEIGEASVADRELAELDLPRAADATSLAAAIERQATPEGRARYFAERRGSLQRACGPLDGGSAQRIATRLLSQADATGAAA
jgi:hypothetical protein